MQKTNKTWEKEPAAPPRVLVLGASGRLGRMVAQGWRDADLCPVWQMRRGRDGAGRMIWSPLQAPAPAALRGRVDVVLGLAGVVPGPDAVLADNLRLGLAALRAGQVLGARHVFLSSSVAVYGRSDQPHPEDEPPAPFTAYGQAKLAMEQAALAEWRAMGPDAPGLTCLRIGNVAGADALLGGSVANWLARPPGDRAPLVLDRFGTAPDGHGPRRAYIGPQGFAQALACLCARAMRGPLPERLNLAAPGVVDMAALLVETGLVAGRDWHWRAAGPQALPVMALDTAQLVALCPMAKEAGQAAQLVGQWQAMRTGAQ